jgi:2-isopropylmalate synthase
MGERVQVFDTTLRDGEQCPGGSLRPEQKLEIAHQLAALGVDVIEAGFPISSPGDFESVRAIARQVQGPVITALARAVREDIDSVWNAVKDTARPQIHVGLSVSDIHIERKLRSNRASVLRQGVEAVAYARSLCDQVQYSAEDAGRADRDYLCETFEAVIEAGASVINVPDTCGYNLPDEFGGLIAFLCASVRGIERAVVSIHCHNDLGLSTANSIAALRSGARRVECTINGIGERAGNAALEEVVMILRTRQAELGFETGIVTSKLAETSAMVSRHNGIAVQLNKAIVGGNAFAHASGIHQDGILKDKLNYEIMRPEDVGMGESRIVLSPRSGRHAFRFRLAELGYHLPDEAFSRAWVDFLALADRKKEITDRDLAMLVASAGASPATVRAASIAEGGG